MKWLIYTWMVTLTYYYTFFKVTYLFCSVLFVGSWKVGLSLDYYVSSSTCHIFFVYVKREKIVPVCKVSTQNLVNYFESEETSVDGWIRTSGGSQHSGSADLELIVLVNYMVCLWPKWACKLLVYTLDT